MSQIDDILLLAGRFAEAKKLSLSRVSTLVFNDGKRLGALRDGRDIGVLSAIVAVQWFADNWPAETAWPAEVKRPHKQIEAAE